MSWSRAWTCRSRSRRPGRERVAVARTDLRRPRRTARLPATGTCAPGTRSPVGGPPCRRPLSVMTWLAQAPPFSPCDGAAWRVSRPRGRRTSGACQLPAGGRALRPPAARGARVRTSGARPGRPPPGSSIPGARPCPRTWAAPASGSRPGGAGPCRAAWPRDRPGPATHRRRRRSPRASAGADVPRSIPLDTYILDGGDGFPGPAPCLPAGPRPAGGWPAPEALHPRAYRGAPPPSPPLI